MLRTAELQLTQFPLLAGSRTIYAWLPAWDAVLANLSRGVDVALAKLLQYRLLMTGYQAGNQVSIAGRVILPIASQ